MGNAKQSRRVPASLKAMNQLGVSRQEAAKALGVSFNTVRRRIAKGKLAAFTLGDGDRVLVDAVALQEAVDAARGEQRG
jgi:excisionase family DNA binding protein